MFNLAPKVANAGTRDLRKLAEIAGGDARTFYVDADLSGVDVRGQDLRGMDISFARLEGILADEHTKVDGRFRAQLLEQALITAQRSFDRNIRARNPVAAGEAGLDVVGILLQLMRPKEASNVIGRMAAAPLSVVRLPTNSQSVLLSSQLGAAVNAYTAKWIETREPKRQEVLAMVQLATFHLRRYQEDILTWVSKRREAIGPMSIVCLLGARSGTWSHNLIHAWGWGGRSREEFKYAHLVDLQLLLTMGRGRWEPWQAEGMRLELAPPTRGGGEAANLAFELAERPARLYSRTGIEALIKRTEATFVTYPNDVETLYLYEVFSIWRRGVGSGVSTGGKKRLATVAAAIVKQHEEMAATLRGKLDSPRNWKKFNSMRLLDSGVP